MSKKNSVSIRVDPKFQKLIRDSRIKRLQDGLDDTPLSDRRLTEALSNIPQIKDILSRSRIDRVKK